MAIKLYWHIHHDTLFETTHDIAERKEYILRHKPVEQKELRLRLLQEVQNPPQVLLKAVADLEAATDVYEQAYAAYSAVSCGRVLRDANYYSASDAYATACDKHTEAFNALKDASDLCAVEMELLHKIECPNCPWDGNTIFPGEE